MKVYLATCCLIITFCFSASAQEEASNRNELSINATGFIANYFNLGGVSSNTVYLVDYKRRVNDKLAFRSSLFLDYSSQNSEQQVARRTYFTSSVANLRVGVEKRQKLAKRWSWFYGADVLAGKSSSVSKSNQQLFDNSIGETVDVKRVFSNTSEDIGIGPITGIRWEISKRIALWTEARLYLVYNENSNENKWEDLTDFFANNPNFDGTKTNNYNTNVNFAPPLDVFFTFKF